MYEKPIIQINPKVIICKILGHKTYEAKYRGEFFGFDCIRCGSRFPYWIGTPDYPDFEEIVSSCKKKIKEKFPNYGNSWVGLNDIEFWERRLNEELDEIWKSKTPEEIRKEIDDAINVLAMIRENTKNFHYPIESIIKEES